MSSDLVENDDALPAEAKQVVATSSSSCCPICLHNMTKSDTRYPLICPTPSCDFNICLNCINGMRSSEQDGYQEASDGSHQVKFCVSCPACRVKYNPLAALKIAASAASSSPKGADEKQPDYDQSVIDHVLLLRRVYAVQLLLDVKDSELSATDLKLKHDFLQHSEDNLTLQDVKDAAILLKKYFKDVKKDHDVPELDWDKLQTLMDETTTTVSSTSKVDPSATSKSNGAKNKPLSEQQSQTQTQLSQQPWRDVTLFYGVLEDVMTISEQEFLTQLFTSGQPDLVAQAAHIVQGILSMSTQRQAQAAVESLSNFGGTGTQTNKSTNSTARNINNTKKAAAMSPKKLAQLRGRFPLPKRMPLCVALPVYDPNSKQSLLTFMNVPPRKKNNNEHNNNHTDHEDLVLARVRGPAGRLGLRRGDVVTHVQGGCETVVNRTQFDEHLLQLVSADNSNGVTSPTAAAAAVNTENSTPVTLLVVNADTETATALRERAIQMRKELKW